MKAAAELTVMDRVHEMTFRKNVFGKHLPQNAINVFTKTRVLLRQAERFVVDDDTVRLMCHMSHEDRMEAWSFLARLPYEVCWFEMDLHAKVREFARMNTLEAAFDPKDVSPRVGYLISRDDPGSVSPKWVVQQFYLFKDDWLPGLLAYVFDPEGGDYAPCRGSQRWKTQGLSSIPGFPKMPVRIKGEARDRDIGIDAEWAVMGHLDTKDGEIVPAGWLVNRAAITPDPWWWAWGVKNEALLLQAKEESGHLRWIVTLLAAINGLPTDIRPVATRVGKRQTRAGILPYFQHRQISIKVPRDNRVVWARQHMDASWRNQPRPLHPVRGHWRIIERGKAPTHLCRHLPTMVENGVGMCEKCELMIRWIEAHDRGDPNVGIVSHYHRVVT